MIDTSIIPNDPGCYLFKGPDEKILYIGKAKNLKKRVSSYFNKTISDMKTSVLVENIMSVDFIATNSEVEALILENNLIKKHKPKYNIDLKDSKRYAYIQLTDEVIPRILVARNHPGKGQFFGPFVSAVERDYLVSVLLRTLRLRTCKRMPKKPCLRYHIHLCDAPCVGKISEEDYSEKISKVKLVLKGKTKVLIEALKIEMELLSKQMNYELAKDYRDQINALQKLSERQNMERIRKTNEDIINYTVNADRVYLMLFNIHQGTLINKSEYVFDATPDFFDEFLVQYYGRNDEVISDDLNLESNQEEKAFDNLQYGNHSRSAIEIILPSIPDPAVVDFLAKNKIMVIVPKQGSKKILLDLVAKNIELSFFGDVKKLDDLQKALRLSETPMVIECFDISHLSGTSMVGSMVQFRGAKPDKSNYRRFKIRDDEKVDDFKALSEIVTRRYKRLALENVQLPDLIVIDGGKGQLSACMDALNQLGLKIPMISIAKKFEEIFVPGLSMPLNLDQKGSALLLLREIRDEAHRFAISYNRLLRKKEITDESIDDI